MLPIAIFENDKSFAQWLEAEIRQHTHYPAVMNTASFDQMKTFIQKNKESTLYFLDIVDETRKNEPVGLDLAREIFQSNESSLVVFVSSYLEHIWYHSEFKTRSFSFIEKNPKHLRREIVETIDLAQRYFDQNALHISGRAEDIHIPFKEICLIESVPHVQNKIRIKGVYGSYILTKTIREIEPLLDDRFLKVHQSYLINQDNIRSIDKRTRQIFFVDGSQCFYARRNTSTINNLSIR